MSVGGALRAALVGFYHQSWRLLILNTLLSASALAILYTATYSTPALVLLVFLGPPTASLVHCAVVLAQTDDLSLREAIVGLRLHWRRGLALAAFTDAVFAFGVFALSFYARRGTFAVALAILVFYLLMLFAVLQLAIWPLAVYEHERPIRHVMLDAAAAVARRAGAWLRLGVALALVNVFGLVVGILPLLTLTIAYTWLAAAYFALPRPPAPEA